MASIHREVRVETGVDVAWAALRDVGNVHALFPGVLTGTRLDGDARIVTFANGLVARELIVDIDDKRRRVAYAVAGGRFTHHSASMQVLDEGGGGSRFVWISDFLPDERTEVVRSLVDQGCAALKAVLGGRLAVERPSSAM